MPSPLARTTPALQGHVSYSGLCRLCPVQLTVPVALTETWRPAAMPRAQWGQGWKVAWGEGPSSLSTHAVPDLAVGVTTVGK